MAGGIDAQRLWNDLETLGRITDADKPFTRRSFSDLHREGRAWLRQRFSHAGLEVSVDGGGNLIGRRHATLERPIAVGSHSDSVPSGGRFDGMAGVLVGLEVARSLADDGVVLRHPLDVIDFLAEEPSEFGVSCVGSRAMAGTMSAAMLASMRPGGGETLAQAIAGMGGDPTRLTSALRPEGSMAAYLELHIEQGRVLEEEGLSVGIVEAIAGISRRAITVEGRADHAGATPMTLRSDALFGAARIIEFVHTRGRQEAESGPAYLVATVGQVSVEPNAPNVVPGKVELILEVRSNVTEARLSFIETVKDFARDDMAALGMEVAFADVTDAPPAVCADLVKDAIHQACHEGNLSHRFMSSGAGHDAMHVAVVAPMGMVFIPCRDGLSHCPDEWTEPEQVAAGAAAILGAVRLLDATLE
jgi:beta-ureidopropionase / N-carbamoyl-L-amino-acid hydrolase